MKKEQVEIKKLGINGEGIGYIRKKICFVEQALPGEIVDVEITKDHPKFYNGKMTKIVRESPYRVASFCKEDKFCQGCHLTKLQYAQHLPFKKGLLKDALKKYTSFDVEKLPIKAVISATKQKGYRQVVSLPVVYFKGKIHVGIYQRESKYLTLMDNCQMHDPKINECLVKIEEILNAYKVRDYNDKVKKGLRFLRLRQVEGRIQLLFVTGEDGMNMDAVKDISKIEAVKSIFMTINTTRYQDFDLQGYKKLYGQSTIPFHCFDQQYLYSMKSQFPVYPEMEIKMMDILKSKIGVDDLVLSLNCGIGLMELSMDQEIVAIDSKSAHIRDAKENAKFLHKNNVSFVCKNSDEAVISQCKKKRFDTVVVRDSELTPAIQQSLILSKVPHVLYVSDHPSTLAKNIEELSQYYQVVSMIPMDTHPYASKFDTIVELRRK